MSVLPPERATKSVIGTPQRENAQMRRGRRVSTTNEAWEAGGTAGESGAVQKHYRNAQPEAVVGGDR